LQESGFLSHLISLKQAKTIILFGSLARSDWHKESDIDLFIYGSDKNLEKGKYELKLKREIQLFTHNSKTLKNLDSNLIKNMIKGDIIKGNIDFLEVALNA